MTSGGNEINERRRKWRGNGTPTGYQRTLNNSITTDKRIGEEGNSQTFHLE